MLIVDVRDGAVHSVEGLFFPGIRRISPEKMAGTPSGLSRSREVVRTGRSPQWDATFENRFSTTTPATISDTPSTAGGSSFSPKTSQPIRAISVTPAPDQIA